MRCAGALVAALLISGNAAALDFRSVSETTMLYDAPSQKAKPLFVIAGGTPVETIVILDAWVKVRDAKGDLAWIERRQLSDHRMLLARERTQVRSEPAADAPLVFEAEPDVLLELVEPAAHGWVKARHRSGQQGYVRIGQVWGN